MPITKINISAVIQLDGHMKSALNVTTSARTTLSTINKRLDAKILARNGTSSRMSAAIKMLSTIEQNISSIKTTVENGINRYSDTERKVNAWESELSSRGVLNVDAAYFGLSSPSSSAFKTTKTGIIDEKKTSDTVWKRVLNDDWKQEGSILSDSTTGTGECFGISTSVTAEGELIGGSVKTKSKATYDIKDKDFDIEKSVTAEGHLAKGSLSGSLGICKGEIEGTVGSVSATGSVGVSLYKDGVFSPAISAEIKAKAVAVEGEAKVTVGDDEYNAHAKAEGSLLIAEAEASGRVGMITYEDEVTGQKITAAGAQGKVGAEAYLAEGKISGGFTIFGIDIDIGVSGKAGGAGVKAEGRATVGGISGEIGAGFVLGFGFKVSIDWSDCTLW